MRNAFVYFGMLFLLLGMATASIQAQEAAPQKFIVFEEIVSPADLPAFIETQTKVKALWDKHNLSIPIFSYRNDDNAFYWVVPIHSFASIDTLYASMMAMHQKMIDEDGFDADLSFKDLYYGEQSIIQWSKELSYHPSGQMGQSMDQPYSEWTFCYLKAGHEKEAAEAVKKYIDFYDRIEETYEWDIYITLLGEGTPLWILMTRSKNPVSLKQLENDLYMKYGKEFTEMWSNFSKHVRKVDNKTGWFQPKFSINLPE